MHMPTESTARTPKPAILANRRATQPCIGRSLSRPKFGHPGTLGDRPPPRLGGMHPFEQHLTEPTGRGPVPPGAHVGSAGGAPCGDLVRVALVLRDGRIAQVTFDADGCGAAIAAGSAVVSLVEGRTVLEAARVGAADVSAELGGLSAGKFHAADLAADALHRALAAACAAGDARAGARRAPRTRAGRDERWRGQRGGRAARARARGREVVAVTLKLWADQEGDGERSCCSPQAVIGARALAHSMGLPHLTLDLEDSFRAAVVDPFVAEHEAGRTPNPCVRCNGQVRFDAMLALAERLGADALATGHYARIEHDAAGAAAGPRRRPPQGSDLHALRPAAGRARARQVPARRAHQATGARDRRGRGAAGGREARQPGPVLSRRHVTRALPRSPRRRARAPRRGRGRAAGACSGATRATVATPSGSAGGWGWPPGSRCSCSPPTRPRTGSWSVLGRRSPRAPSCCGT